MLTNRQGQSIGIALLAVMVAMSSTACQGSRNSNKVEATVGGAKLDFNTGEISLPLDPYVFSSDDSREVELYQKARDKAMERCMVDAGFSYRRYQGFIPRLKHTTRYGVWNLEQAKVHGFDESPITDEERQRIEADAAEYDQEGGAEEYDQKYYDTYDKCSKEAEEMVKTVVSIEDFEEVQQIRSSLIQLAEHARKEAVGDPRWRQSREEWNKCIEKGGLTPLPYNKREDANIYGNLDIVSEEARKVLGYGSVNPQDTEDESEDSSGEGSEEQGSAGFDADSNRQEEIRIAVVEAQCNVDTGLARKLADIEAINQKKLMDENEDSLQKEREIRDRIISKLEKFILGQGESGSGA